MTGKTGNFHFTSFDVNPISERFAWQKRLEWMPEDLPWPPKGKELTFTFNIAEQDIQAIPSDSIEAPEYLTDITIVVHYNLYANIPLICKWISIENNSDRIVTIDKFKIV